MLLLLIIADDFTGALDTGVQFAAYGAATRVMVKDQVDFASCDAQVLVVDTETRHLPPEKAYQIVEELTRAACRAGIRYIYKKTDSALRGNIGAELAAVLQASNNRQLPFLPAFPQNGRTTRDGIHYVDGVPVTKPLRRGSVRAGPACTDHRTAGRADGCTGCQLPASARRLSGTGEGRHSGF